MEKVKINKYQQGKIYKIISNQTNDIYYGSTSERLLSRRFANHRSAYKKWLNGNLDYTTSYEVLKCNNCKIILVENFPCNSKDELKAREQFYIDNNVCVNKFKAMTLMSQKEYKKEYSKEWYIKNKDKTTSQRKIYRNNNKEKISHHNNEYYTKNKEKVLNQKKTYYAENRDKILEEHKQYYIKNKQRIRERQKQYRENNKIRNDNNIV